MSASFFDAIRQDRVLGGVKLIAEPWDLGPGGYQLGRFPIGWGEWNGKYRDITRRYWRGDPGQVGEFASRLAGSSDLFEHSQRSPQSSSACRVSSDFSNQASFTGAWPR